MNPSIFQRVVFFPLSIAKISKLYEKASFIKQSYFSFQQYGRSYFDQVHFERHPGSGRRGRHSWPIPHREPRDRRFRNKRSSKLSRPCRFPNARRQIQGRHRRNQGNLVFIHFKTSTVHNLSLLCQALRQKEKGDWRKLSIEEKKALYRSSFCQTFAEFEVMDDDWKAAWGYSLIVMSLSLWLYMFLKLYGTYGKYNRNSVLSYAFDNFIIFDVSAFNPIPESFSEANQKLQLKRMLDLQVNPVDGLSSKWDYENNRWK